MTKTERSAPRQRAGVERAWCRLGILMAPSLLALFLGASDLRAQSVDSTMWCLGPGDRVLASARVGNTIYLGGLFSSVGPATGGGVPISIPTAAPAPEFPRVAGEVNAVVPDGQGGWYIGGLFNAVAMMAKAAEALALAKSQAKQAIALAAKSAVAPEVIAKPAPVVVAPVAAGPTPVRNPDAAGIPKYAVSQIR